MRQVSLDIPDGRFLWEQLPDYFQIIKDYVELMDTEEIQFRELYGFLQRINDNFFIQTMDAETIATYELLLNIPVQDGETLEFRRWRINNRYKRRPPYTLPMLKELLNEMAGIGQWEIEQDINNYYLKVIVKNGSYGILNEVQTTLIELIPAHISQEVEQQLVPEPVSTIHYGTLLKISNQYNLT